MLLRIVGDQEFVPTSLNSSVGNIIPCLYNMNMTSFMLSFFPNSATVSSGLSPPSESVSRSMTLSCITILCYHHLIGAFLL